jgi:membrane-bound ClpP family serine protease
MLSIPGPSWSSRWDTGVIHCPLLSDLACPMHLIAVVGVGFKTDKAMAKSILIALVVGFLLFEFVEHLLFPLVWFVLGKKRRSTSGAEGMLGKVVEVRQWNRNEGQVLVNGELWRAVSDVPLTEGDEAVIYDIKGLILKVRLPERDRCIEVEKSLLRPSRMTR